MRIRAIYVAAIATAIALQAGCASPDKLSPKEERTIQAWKDWGAQQQAEYEARQK